MNEMTVMNNWHGIAETGVDYEPIERVIEDLNKININKSNRNRKFINRVTKLYLQQQTCVDKPVKNGREILVAYREQNVFMIFKFYQIAENLTFLMTCY